MKPTAVARSQPAPLSIGRTVTNKMSATRRQNLRRLMDKNGGPKRLAELLGYRNASFLVQMAGPNPTREVTEKSARRFESILRLQQGFMDLRPERGHRVVGPSNDLSLAVDVIRLVGQVCQQEGIMLPPMKFADLAAFVLSDVAEAGRKPRANSVRRLLSLLRE